VDDLRKAPLDLADTPASPWRSRRQQRPIGRTSYSSLAAVTRNRVRVLSSRRSAGGSPSAFDGSVGPLASRIWRVWEPTLGNAGAERDRCLRETELSARSPRGSCCGRERGVRPTTGQTVLFVREPAISREPSPRAMSGCRRPQRQHGLCAYDQSVLRDLDCDASTTTDRPISMPHAQGSAKVRIDSLEVIDSSLPRRQLRFLLAWVELHQDELRQNWRRARAGETLPADRAGPMIGLTPDITEATVIRHGALRLRFADGLSGQVEVLDRMGGPVFDQARTPRASPRSRLTPRAAQSSGLAARTLHRTPCTRVFAPGHGQTTTRPPSTAARRESRQLVTHSLPKPR
jgi:hypothetical protein